MKGLLMGVSLGAVLITASATIGTTSALGASAPKSSGSPLSSPADSVAIVGARIPERVLRRTWNPWRSACASTVTAGVFALGFWTLARVASVGKWIAGHFVESSVLKSMLGYFSWSWVYTVAYNYVC